MNTVDTFQSTIMTNNSNTSYIIILETNINSENT